MRRNKRFPVLKKHVGDPCLNLPDCVTRKACHEFCEEGKEK